MTRDYAKNITSAISFKCDGKQSVTVDGACELIDQIYDTIESYLKRRMEQRGTTHEQRCVLQEVYESIGGKE